MLTMSHLSRFRFSTLPVACLLWGCAGDGWGCRGADQFADASSRRSDGAVKARSGVLPGSD